jgi:hypothetical protein
MQPGIDGEPFVDAAEVGDIEVGAGLGRDPVNARYP